MTETKKSTKWQIFTFSGGNFANTLAYQVLGNRVQFFYIDILGLNAAIAGLVWTIYGIWNMVNDPLMGQLTDRTRSKYGRRIPYIYFGAIPLGLSFFFLWMPITTSPWIMALYFFMTLFIFDTLYSLIIIAYNALFPEIAESLAERISLSTIRALGRSLPADETTTQSYTIPDIIQTDAPINPGNSGGVLVMYRDRCWA